MSDSSYTDGNGEGEFTSAVRIRTGPQWLSDLKRRVGKRLVDDE